MSRQAERLRSVMATPGCTAVAPVFDPLSARIADVLGWKIGKLPGSTAKSANLGLPDGVDLSNATDLVGICRALTQMADLSLIVDADDGGTPLQLHRLVRELEAVGVAAIELDDVTSPNHFHDAAPLVPLGAQVAKLTAAVDSKREDTTMIVGRTSALHHLSLAESEARIAAYAGTGIDALMLPGLHNGGISTDPRRDIEAVQAASTLPLFVSGLPADLLGDTAWLEQQRIKLLFHGPHAYKMAVRAVHDAFSHLHNGGDPAELIASHADDALLDAVVGLKDFEAWDERYSRMERQVGEPAGLVQDQRTNEANRSST